MYQQLEKEVKTEKMKAKDAEYQVLKRYMVGDGVPVFMLERWQDAANIYRDAIFIECVSARKHLKKYDSPRLMVAAYLDLLKVKILEGKIPVFLNGKVITEDKKE